MLLRCCRPIFAACCLPVWPSAGAIILSFQVFLARAYHRSRVRAFIFCMRGVPLPPRVGIAKSQREEIVYVATCR